MTTMPSRALLCLDGLVCSETHFARGEHAPENQHDDGRKNHRDRERDHPLRVAARTLDKITDERRTSAAAEASERVEQTDPACGCRSAQERTRQAEERPV